MPEVKDFIDISVIYITRDSIDCMRKTVNKQIFISAYDLYNLGNATSFYLRITLQIMKSVLYLYINTHLLYCLYKYMEDILKP